ncbi:MAG: hypothetical protein JNK78_05870 [Planctomycetes bacterium]|nr:hypothetical protein [Planctomycetota bacterium]
MSTARVLDWTLAAVAVWLAWSAAMELCIAWYSGGEGDVPPTRWWLGVARVVVFLLAAAVVVATEVVSRDG